MMNPVHLISQSAFFKGISPAGREALARVCIPLERRKNTILFTEGETGQAFFLLVRGRVRLHKTSPDGREVVIKIIKPGEVFAEVILFEESRYPVTAVAVTDALFLRIPRRDLLRLLAAEDFRIDFIAMLMRKQRYLAGRIHELTTLSVDERLLSFLREQYGPGEHLTAAVTKKEVAKAIGTTPETLSRVIRRLGRRNVMTWKGRTIRLSPGFQAGR